MTAAPTVFAKQKFRVENGTHVTTARSADVVDTPLLTFPCAGI
jgi:hypothetical protein